MKNYRIIIKCKAGFFTVVDHKSTSPLNCLKAFKLRSVHSIEEQYESEPLYTTVFSLKGSSVYIASKDIIESGIIQYNWSKTNMNNVKKPVTEWDRKVNQ
jgi:hypothetical protein